MSYGRLTDSNINTVCEHVGCNKRHNIQVSQCSKRWYLRRLRAVGVMEAVGEEDRESGEEAALIAIREAEEAPS